MVRLVIPAQLISIPNGALLSFPTTTPWPKSQQFFNIPDTYNKVNVALSLSTVGVLTLNTQGGASWGSRIVEYPTI
jgi:hypothetical protein